MKQIKQMSSSPLLAPSLTRSLFRPGNLLAALICLLGLSATAQTVTFKSFQTRVTVPVNFSGTVNVSNKVSFSGVTLPVDFTVAGALPAGVAVSITDTNGNALPVDNGLPSSAISTNIYVKFTFTGAAEGVYPLFLTGSGGATNSLPIYLQVGYIWNGSTNAAADGAGIWSDSSKWLGGAAPGAGDDAIFNGGGQTNTFYINTGTTPPSTNALVNSIINQDTTVGSIRFMQTNSVTKYHNLQITPGHKLTLTGPNGFGYLRDFINSPSGLNSGMTVTILGTNASLVVSNYSANFSLLNDNQNAYLLDMSTLDVFKANVNKFGPGDYTTWPSFPGFDANGYSGLPSKFACSITLAKTNLITTSFTDPNQYTNSTTRQFALGYMIQEFGSGSSSAGNFILGISNVFLVDSVNLVGYGLQGNVKFNPLFVSNNPVAIFHGTNGGRMAVFAVCDGAGPNGAQGNTKALNIDFGTSKGKVDILADQFYASRDRALIVGAQTATFQSAIAFGAGTVDVNSAVLGYQDAGGHTNQVAFAGQCTATLVVSNTAVFKVNSTLTLGFTSETNLAFGTPGLTTGKINIGPGGTVIANNISVGGLTKGSAANNIVLSSPAGAPVASLIVSNTIADNTMALSTLTLGGNAALTLFVDGSLGRPLVYVTNLTTATALGGNTIKIGGIKNLTFTAGTAQVPLISYLAGGSPAIPNVTLPLGFIGSASIIPVNGNEWDLLVSTNAAKTNLVWRAPGDATGTASWDTSSKVWADLANGGTLTNFNNGDSVRFDDTPGYATNINQTEAVLLPGAITISNSTLRYTLQGSGLQGGGVLTKTGAGTLEIDGSALVGIALAQGSLTNASTASVGGISVASGATLASAGSIFGGINSAGLSTLLTGGSLIGSFTVLSGGVVTNYGSVDGNGSLSVQNGAFVYNGASGVFDNFGSGTLSSNATFINEGALGNGSKTTSLTVSGTLKDTGVGSLQLLTLTVNAGGLVIPGGDGVGTTIDYQPIGTGATFPGSAQFATGSTNILKVNTDLGVNTLFQSHSLSFGPSSSQQSLGGCTLVITNVGSADYTPGMKFRFFESDLGGNPNSTGSSTNTFPAISPKAPGPGLAWDLSHLWTADGSGHYGIIGITAVNPNPTNIVMSAQFFYPLTYLVGTNSVTNNVIITHLQWPQDHTGWRLQQQNSTVAVGLGTNWQDVVSSLSTDDLYFTNVITKDSATFFRMVYP